jgi:prophage antirepressor-like protein
MNNNNFAQKNTNALLMVFENEKFGKIRVAGTSEDPLFCLTDICRVLGLHTGMTKQRLDQRGVSLIDTPTLNQHGAEVIQQLIYINEKNLYKIIMRSNKPQAEQFQDWVCGEVLPSIRKHGAYMTDEVAKKVIESPDFLIQLAMEIKEEKMKRELAEKNLAIAETKIEEQVEVIKHKSDVIEGLTDEIPTAELRQRIVQIVSNASPKSIPNRYNLLYEEFEKKYHVSLNKRIWNAEERVWCIRTGLII